jgi:hypothetical protein
MDSGIHDEGHSLSVGVTLCSARRLDGCSECTLQHEPNRGDGRSGVGM